MNPVVALRPPVSLYLAILVLLLSLVACGSDTEPAPDATTDTRTRVEEISEHVDTWRSAEDLIEATAAAEAAANLVVGPNGPGYGDRNGDGRVDGETDIGLLPGIDGSPAGLVLNELGTASCVDRDVLGGPWDDPAMRWGELDRAIDEWAPTNNTFPLLASHPMRIVGWATLTQGATLEQAHEFAGHAGLHVSVTTSALDGC